MIKPRDDEALNQVLAQAQFCNVDELAFSGDATWRAELLQESGEAFRIWHRGEAIAEIHWSLIGRFNVENGLAAFAASFHAGVAPEVAARALEKFTPVNAIAIFKNVNSGPIPVKIVGAV